MFAHTCVLMCDHTWVLVCAHVRSYMDVMCAHVRSYTSANVRPCAHTLVVVRSCVLMCAHVAVNDFVDVIMLNDGNASTLTISSCEPM